MAIHPNVKYDQNYLYWQYSEIMISYEWYTIESVYESSSAIRILMTLAMCCFLFKSSSFPLSFYHSPSAPLAFYRSHMKYEIFMNFDIAHFSALFPLFQANAAFFCKNCTLISILHFQCIEIRS